LVRWLRRGYERIVPSLIARPGRVIVLACIPLLAALFAYRYLGGEFMPKLEEGNLWVRATLPQDVSSETAFRLADQIRAELLGYQQEVTHVVSQCGRPDDGTDVTTFNNIEFFIQLKPRSQWPRGLSKLKLVEQMSAALQKFPGISFGFSQNIEDNVEEAMSGVKGENAIKLFGEDLDVLAEKAEQMRQVMSQVRGIADLAVFHETGQPELLVSID